MRNVPSEFTVGSKASTEEVVLDPFERFSKSGFLLTLDYSRAFDRLNPFVADRLLLRLGWPAYVVAVLTAVGGQQRRWVQWRSHVHECPLEAPAMPQGDPFGPIIMRLWVVVGGANVDSDCSRDNVLSRFYVDDRSVVASSAVKLDRRYRSLSEWSSKVGALRKTS